MPPCGISQLLFLIALGPGLSVVPLQNPKKTLACTITVSVYSAALKAPEFETEGCLLPPGRRSTPDFRAASLSYPTCFVVLPRRVVLQCITMHARGATLAATWNTLRLLGCRNPLLQLPEPLGVDNIRPSGSDSERKLAEYGRQKLKGHRKNSRNDFARRSGSRAAGA